VKLVTVSIALTTYNGALHLQEQLDSYVKQTRRPDEVVICDDGSTDDTLSIITEFVKTAPFSVRVIRNDHNLGYTQNFAKALSLCSGDIVLLSDQDDAWFYNKIERALALAVEESKCWVLVHDGQLTNQTGYPTGLTKMGQIRSGYGSSDYTITGALSMVRREFLLIALPIPDDVIGHDIWLHKLCSLFEGRRIVTNDCLQIIRRHDSNTSEWVVNSSKKIKPLDVLKAQMRTRPATDYGERIALNMGLRARLSEVVAARLDRQDQESVTAALVRLEREHRALSARQNLAQSGALARRLQALAMLVRRDYAEFNGLRSFLRDMVR